MASLINILEQKVNYQLNKYPAIKHIAKRLYQRLMCAASHKPKKRGDIIRVTPDDGYEYFFGYYDKSPWDISGRYMLCLRAKDTWSKADNSDIAEIVVIDTFNNNATRILATTRSWNVQQGCMLQWLGPDFSSRIIYNDVLNGNYCSIILEVATGQKQVIGQPVYSVSQDGSTALSLDFSRLHNLRPGYGYSNIPERTKGVSLPETTAIWKIDLNSGEVVPLLKYTDFASFQPRPEMKLQSAVHKVNHLMLSPDGKRFMVLYRWFNGPRKYTRLITCNVDGSDMYLLNDDDMVSHCFWKSDEEILAFERKKDLGCGYYLMKDKTQDYQRLWPFISGDGHPSYSPADNHTVVTDSYPNRYRISTIRILHDNDMSNDNIIAEVFCPFRYDNDTRCDCHPRWSRDGKSICFDGVFEGHRGLYMLNLKQQ